MKQAQYRDTAREDLPEGPLHIAATPHMLRNTAIGAAAGVGLGGATALASQYTRRPTRSLEESLTLIAELAGLGAGAGAAGTATNHLASKLHENTSVRDAQSFARHGSPYAKKLLAEYHRNKHKQAQDITLISAPLANQRHADALHDEKRRRKARVNKVLGALMGMEYGAGLGATLGGEVFGHKNIFGKGPFDRKRALQGAGIGAVVGSSAGLLGGTILNHVHKYTGEDQPQAPQIHLVANPSRELVQQVQAAMKQGSAIGRTLGVFSGMMKVSYDGTVSPRSAANGQEDPQLANAPKTYGEPIRGGAIKPITQKQKTPEPPFGVKKGQALILGLTAKLAQMPPSPQPQWAQQAELQMQTPAGLSAIRNHQPQAPAAKPMLPPSVGGNGSSIKTPARGVMGSPTSAINQ